MPIAVHHTDWIFWVLLLAIALLLAARLYNPVRFRAFLILPFHIKRQELESSFNPTVGRGLFDVSLSLLSYLMLGLSFFLILHPFEGAPPVLSDWRNFLRLLFVVLLFFLVKNLVGLFVGWVFQHTDEIARAQNVNLAYRAWIAMMLVPVCALVAFYQPLYQVSYYLLWIGLFVGYYFALQFSFFRLWKMEALPYYKIFYLCTLEITPLLFLVGWLKSLYE